MGFFSKFKSSKPEEPEAFVPPEQIQPENAYFGREPIVDKNSVLMGFELFFRMGTEDAADRANAIALKRAELIFAGATPEEIAEKDLNPDSYLPAEDDESSLNESNLEGSDESDESSEVSNEEQGQEKQSESAQEDASEDPPELPPEPFVKSAA